MHEFEPGVEPRRAATKAECLDYASVNPMAGDVYGNEGTYSMLPPGCQKFTDPWYLGYTRVLWNNGGLTTHNEAGVAVDNCRTGWCLRSFSNKIGWLSEFPIEQKDDGFGVMRGCLTLTQPMLPAGLPSFQACMDPDPKKWFMDLSVTAGGVWTVGGRLEFGCLFWEWCAPSGGSLYVERPLTNVYSKKGRADDRHGGKYDSVVSIDGLLGFMIGMAAAADEANGGVDVTLSPYGAFTVSGFDGWLNCRATMTGSLTMSNVKFDPFGINGGIRVSIEIRVKARIISAEFHISLTMNQDATWNCIVEFTQFLSSLSKALYAGGTAISCGIATRAKAIQNFLGIEAANFNNPQNAYRQPGGGSAKLTYWEKQQTCWE